MLPSSAKTFFRKERQIEGSLIKSITLPENTHVRHITFFPQ